MPDETPDELYDEQGSTPSQRELDTATQGNQVADALRFQGQLIEAKRQIQNRIARGGSKEHGRQLLGQVDELSQSGDPDAATLLGQSMDTFIHGGAGAAPASQSAAPVKQAAGARPAAPRPSTPATRARDNQKLMDSTTPIEEVRAIRARQKAAGG